MAGHGCGLLQECTTQVLGEQIYLWASPEMLRYVPGPRSLRSVEGSSFTGCVISRLA